MNAPFFLDPGLDARWDDFVETHPLGQVYHLSAWKKVLEASFRHIRGHHVVMGDGEDGEIVIRAGLPVYEVKSWLTGNRLVAAPFATLFDPLVSGPEDLGPLLDTITETARDKRADYVEIRTLDAPAWFAGKAFGESRCYLHHYIRLDAPLDNIWKSFHRSCVRQRVTRAESSGLLVREATTRSDLLAFFRLLTKTRRKRSLPPHPLRFLESMWNVLRPAGRLKLIMAEKNGTPVAGLMLLTFKDRVTAEHLGSDAAFKSISPVHGLFWHGIRWAHGQGFRIFDFGRTAPTNTSLLDFKSRWGTSCRELSTFLWPAEVAGKRASPEASWKYRLAQTLSSRGMPVFVGRIVGNFCYRHLG